MQNHGEETVPLRVGIDTGGTFTDFSCLDSTGRWRRWKTLSTPDDPSRAIMEGIGHLLPDIPLDSIELVHGTTVGTNAFLERKGARTLLVTTMGFEDVVLIGRQARPALYDLKQRPSKPVLEQGMIAGVRERLNFRGEVITPLHDREVQRIVELCRRLEPESVAVCFLHSYANPAHEELVADAISEAGFPVSVSSQIMPEFREYERTSTTVVNAYLGPVVGNYIRRLEKKFPDTAIFVQQSNGGCVPAANTGKQAVKTLLSGPAAGVMAALELGRRTGFPDIITFDMGGTSTDVSLCQGKLTYTRDYVIEGFPVALPFIDIHTVGAGGGSVAWIDRGGLMAVGPESAGADPGPVCYGKGDRVTVTDANLFLGRLRQDTFLGGRMKLYPERSAAAITELAAELHMDAVRAALGIIQLVNTNMVQAIRAVSVERGYDPRDFTLVCFGGAAGMHALEVADELEIGRVIVPENAGIFSARGMSVADITVERSMAVMKGMEGPESDKEIEASFDRLVVDVLNEIRSAGMPHGETGFRRWVDARYRGQSFELSIPWGATWRDDMHMAHERLYGYSMPDSGLEITAIRLMAVIKRPGTAREPHENRNGGAGMSPARQFDYSEVIFRDMTLNVPVVNWNDLKGMGCLEGPCLVTDRFTTITVPAGWSLAMKDNNMICNKIGRGECQKR